jgi:hypothetical protein
VPQHCFCVVWLLAGTKTCSYKEDARRRRPNPKSTPPSRYATFPPLLRVRVLLNPPTIPSSKLQLAARSRPAGAGRRGGTGDDRRLHRADWPLPSLRPRCKRAPGGHALRRRAYAGHGRRDDPAYARWRSRTDARRERENRALRLGTQSMINHVVTLSKETAPGNSFSISI